MQRKTHFLSRDGKDKHSDSYSVSYETISPPSAGSESVSRADRAAELAFHLRAIRRAKRLTQSDIASLSGLQHQNVSRFEREGSATLSTVLRYTAALGGTLVFSADPPSGSAAEPEQPFDGI